jgi:hypothetical protein
LGDPDRYAGCAGTDLLGQFEQFFDVVDLGDLAVDDAHDVVAVDGDRVAADMNGRH